MAISAVPYALQNGSHSADLFRQASSSLVPPGGGLVTTGDLAVTQTGTASMNIVVGVGRAWVPGTNVGNVTGGNFSKQAMYFALNDAAVTVSVATSDPTNPRIDVVYLAIQDSQYAGTTNTAVLGVATGVAAAGATYPANAPTIPANAIALAWINVPANAASILTANITQLAIIGIVTAVPQGLKSKITVTANSGSINNTFTVVSNVPTFTFKANRHYRLSWRSAFQTSVNNAAAGFLVGTCPTTDPAGQATGVTQINGSIYTAPVGAQNSTAVLDAYYDPGVADATLQIKWMANVASGTMTLTASSISPNYFTIEDLGAAF